MHRLLLDEICTAVSTGHALPIIIRSPRRHDILRSMIPYSVGSLSVTWLRCANTAKRIEVVLGMETLGVSRTDSMRPSLNYFGHLLVFISPCDSQTQAYSFTTKHVFLALISMCLHGIDQCDGIDTSWNSHIISACTVLCLSFMCSSSSIIGSQSQLCVRR